MSAIAIVFETGSDGHNAPWDRYNARGFCEVDRFVLVVALCDKCMAQPAALHWQPCATAPPPGVGHRPY